MSYRLFSSRTWLRIYVLAMSSIIVIYALFLANHSKGFDFPSLAIGLLITLFYAFITLVIITPLALGFAMYCFDVASHSMSRPMIRIVSILSSFPPIACAIAILVLVLENGGKPSSFWAVVCLCLCSLPRLCSHFVRVLRNVPEGYQMASLALGANANRATLGIVLRVAKKDILSSMLLLSAFIVNQLSVVYIALGLFAGNATTEIMPLTTTILRSVVAGDMATAAMSALVLLVIGCILTYASRSIAEVTV